MGQLSAWMSAVREISGSGGADAIRARIGLATTPRSLKTADRRALLRELKKSGSLEIRRSMVLVAMHLGVSRATVHSDAK